MAEELKGRVFQEPETRQLAYVGAPCPEHPDCFICEIFTGPIRPGSDHVPVASGSIHLIREKIVEILEAARPFADVPTKLQLRVLNRIHVADSGWLDGLDAAQRQEIQSEFTQLYEASLSRQTGPRVHTEAANRDWLDKWYPEAIRFASFHDVKWGIDFLALEHESEDAPFVLVYSGRDMHDLRRFSLRRSWARQIAWPVVSVLIGAGVFSLRSLITFGSAIAFAILIVPVFLVQSWRAFEATVEIRQVHTARKRAKADRLKARAEVPVVHVA